MKVKARFAKAIDSQFHHLGRETTYIHNDSETQALFTAVISFWFSQRALLKARA